MYLFCYSLSQSQYLDYVDNPAGIDNTKPGHLYRGSHKDGYSDLICKQNCDGQLIIIYVLIS